MVKDNQQEPKIASDWITPSFVSLKKKKTKRFKSIP
jgi:hypothetical protein